MSATAQYSLRVGDEREEVPRAGEVLRLGVRCDGGPDRCDPVCGRDAGRDARGRFDGYREIGALAVGVVPDHGRQLQLPGFFGGDAETDDPAAAADQPGHLCDGDAFGRKDQVPFVLPVFVVGEQDSRSPAQRLGGSLYAADCLGFDSCVIFHGKVVFYDRANLMRSGIRNLWYICIK